MFKLFDSNCDLSSLTDHNPCKDEKNPCPSTRKCEPIVLHASRQISYRCVGKIIEKNIHIVFIYVVCYYKMKSFSNSNSIKFFSKTFPKLLHISSYQLLQNA